MATELPTDEGAQLVGVIRQNTERAKAKDMAEAESSAQHVGGRIFHAGLGAAEGGIIGKSCTGGKVGTGSAANGRVTIGPMTRARWADAD